MKNKLSKTLILLLLLLLPTFLLIIPVKADDNYDNLEIDEGNDYPIVFVHGFAMWGPGEMLGLLNSWGFFKSIPDMLRENGYEVYEVKVGPLSSVWDRAIDCFYDLKGGMIDYGENHSLINGHNRFSKILEGKYPEWGELNPDGTRKKVHIIGHSMGGQTIRTLVQLLGDIRPEEGDSQLFSEDLSDWVASITSISAVHDGCSLAALGDEADNLLSSFVTKILAVIGAAYSLIGGSLAADNLYDPMLDHWNVTKNSGESIFEFIDRVAQSGLFRNDQKDFALWDLAPQGAYELNDWVVADPDVYYFSYSTTTSQKLPFLPFHIPRLTTDPLLYPTTIIIGCYAIDHGQVEINEDWFENDGIVNTISMNGPKINSPDIIVPYDPNNVEPGIWNDMGKIRWDHVQVIGFLSDWSRIKAFYLGHAEILAQLPKDDPVNEPIIQSMGIQDIIEGINNVEPLGMPEDNPYTDPASYEGGTPPNATEVDCDGDEMVNIWELKNELNPNDTNDMGLDTDSDGLTNLQEYILQTSANDGDTDSDGMQDSWEAIHGLNPRIDDSSSDFDNDLLSNFLESIYGTDPWMSDTDGDGFDDKVEIEMGSDPLNANIIPRLPETKENFFIMILIVSIVGIASIIPVIGIYKSKKVRQTPYISKTMRNTYFKKRIEFLDDENNFSLYS